jgi:hypothetical protein
LFSREDVEGEVVWLGLGKDVEVEVEPERPKESV